MFSITAIEIIYALKFAVAKTTHFEAGVCVGLRICYPKDLSLTRLSYSKEFILIQKIHF
jgi:hypothetical protein